ncbi:hypothetical protein BBJ28_00002986 [Nothophytophthora sp. Chile5]|nr:hypothetical protein BBJ28_00002986 [Nothophytophthora sp. Chile5]
MTVSHDVGGAALVASHGKVRSPQVEEKDEKVLRRRLQYKFHQRRHRAKQKQRVMTLEQEVQALMADVETLNRRRQKLLVDSNWFSSRGTASGVPARVTREYFRLFEFGISPTNLRQQEQFLRSVMTADTKGPDYVGVDFIVAQWQRFDAFYAYTRHEPVSMDVSTASDLTFVVVDSFFHIRANRDGIVTLYPSLRGESELMQKVVGNMISVPVQYRFTFDANGVITWFGADWDLVTALRGTLGSMVDVSNVLASARISSTGQIGCTEEDLRCASIDDGVGAPVDPRLNVDFLLS